MAADTQTQPQPLSTGSSDLEKRSAEHESAVSPVDDAVDTVEAKRIIRKIDFRLVPLLSFLYMLTFLDRVNIGNARLWNLEKDLGMSGYDYNIAVLGMGFFLFLYYMCRISTSPLARI